LKQSITNRFQQPNDKQTEKRKMRTFIMLASMLAVALALPGKVKRDAPYPAAVPVPVLHETYGPPLVKEVEHTEDCVADGRWIDDVHDRKWDDTPETPEPVLVEYKVVELPKPHVVETTIVHTLPEKPHVVETTIVHSLPEKPHLVETTIVHTLPEKPNTDYGLPAINFGEYKPPTLPEIKFEVPTLHTEYGPPPAPLEEVKLFPYPAAVPLVKVEEHDENCVVDGRWINDLGKKYD
jgi:hypothetical protein